MKPNVFIFSNSNLFAVTALSALSEKHDCDVLNLRYNNEDLTKSEHLLQQIDALFAAPLLKKGSILTNQDFSFTETLMYRIDRLFRQADPAILLFEMRTGRAAEWLVLDYLSDQHHVPSAVYLPPAIEEDDVILRLMGLGINEVFTKLETPIIADIAKRTIASRSS